MAADLDVAGRLAEARQAVDDTQCYVWACHLLDYQNPDLTTHPAQIRDWFSSEDGMDLHVLDTDRSALQAVAAAADDALGRQRDQLGRLTSAWTGAGSASAEDFLRRHCDTAETVAAAVHAAMDGLGGLRDALWKIVDTKVAAANAIVDRRQDQRPGWLGAAQTVIAGVGDRAAASELLDRQVKPFVDNDIRVDWLTAVRTAIASINGSYDAAIAGLLPSPADFDVPADLGPEWSPPPGRDGDAPVDGPVPTSSAGVAPSTPVVAPSAPQQPMPVNVPAMQSMPSPTAMPAGAGPMPAATGSSPMMPTTPASGLEGMGQRFADALGSLLSSTGDSALPKPPDVQPSALDEPVKADARNEETTPPAKDKPGNEPACGTSEDTTPAPDAQPGNSNPVSAPPVEEVPPPPAEAPPPPVEPPAPPVEPPAPPPSDGSTPCEIAADELPQAGQ